MSTRGYREKKIKGKRKYGEKNAGKGKNDISVCALLHTTSVDEGDLRLLTSASAGLFFIHHLDMASASALAMRGRVRDNAPTVMVL